MAGRIQKILRRWGGGGGSDEPVKDIVNWLKNSQKHYLFSYGERKILRI